MADYDNPEPSFHSLSISDTSEDGEDPPITSQCVLLPTLAQMHLLPLTALPFLRLYFTENIENSFNFMSVIDVPGWAGPCGAGVIPAAVRNRGKVTARDADTTATQTAT